MTLNRVEVWKKIDFDVFKINGKEADYWPLGPFEPSVSRLCYSAPVIAFGERR